MRSLHGNWIRLKLLKFNMEQLESRPFKNGDSVLIKGTKIKAVVKSCELINGTWTYKLEGWPGKIVSDLIETAGHRK